MAGEGDRDGPKARRIHRAQGHHCQTRISGALGCEITLDLVLVPLRSDETRPGTRIEYGHHAVRNSPPPPPKTPAAAQDPRSRT